MNNLLANKEVWFITGSQHLYGEETLNKVSSNAQTIAEALNESSLIPLKIVFKPILTNPGDIANLCLEANANSLCVGLITWMHTFSPAKMWINGLKQLQKPICHLHTQFNRDIPWNEIDMDFMNLNQSAHGGREYGFINSRLRIERKVIAGHWKDPKVVERLAVWTRAAAAWSEWQTGKVARFGDNMREVAVTEGDKVAAQLKFGFSVNGYGVGDLVEVVNDVTDGEVQATLDEYAQTYGGVKKLLGDENMTRKLSDSARIEVGMRKFLQAGDFFAFTTTFEDLHGLSQLPGLAVQRLMKEGYGFGAEGDWKTAALVRAMKVMDTGLHGGTSFMEDYTYHFDPDGAKVLGAHMLEVCPSIAADAPDLEIHPLGIGGKEDPARLVFNVKPGDAINASLMDMGNRFRMLINEVKVVAPENLPKLPVARALWEPKPDLSTAAEMWILAGGAHHTGFSLSVSAEHMQDFAEMAGIECLIIDGQSSIREFKNELRWNDLYYTMNAGLRQ